MAKDKESRKNKLDFNIDDPVFGSAPVTPSLGVGEATAVDRTVGRPRMPKKDRESDKHRPQEEHYLAGDIYLPYSTSIRSDLYLKLKRLEFHRKQSMRVILEEMLEDYIAKQPLAKRSLPEKEIDKLKQLKSAVDYHHERKEE